MADDTERTDDSQRHALLDPQPPPAGATVSSIRSFLVSQSARGGSLAVIDQGVSSATRFFSAVIVGRVCGPEELGIYSLAFVGLLLTMIVQDALIIAPYTVYSNRAEEKDLAVYAGSVLVFQLFYTVVATLFLGLVGVVLVSGLGMTRLPQVIWVIAGLVPFMLLREFGRRFAFAQLDLGTALAVDISVAAMQLGGLLFLAWSGALSALTSYLVIGVACAVTSIGWIIRARKRFHVRASDLRGHWRRNWRFGRWAFAGQVVGITHGYTIHWLLAIMLGTVTTGILAASQSIAMLANPVVLGVTGYLEPRSAKAFAVGGTDSMVRVVRGTMLLFGAVMAILCTGLFLVGDQIVALLYGDAYGGHRYVIVLLALAAGCSALSAALGSGLSAIERPDVNCKMRMVGLAVTAVSAPLLIGPWGLLGATCGLLAGSLAALGVKWTLFVRLVAKQRSARDSPGPGTRGPSRLTAPSRGVHRS